MNARKSIAAAVVALALVVAGVAFGANRAYRQNLRALDSQLLFAHAEVVIGAGGQVSNYGGPEVTAAARTTTGQYTISFDKGGYALGAGENCTLFNPTALGFFCTVQSSTPSTGTVVLVTSSASSPTTLRSLPSGAHIELIKRYNLSTINP